MEVFGYVFSRFCCSKPSSSLQGYTEITIVPTSSELRTIHLHSRQCSAYYSWWKDLQGTQNRSAIHNVTVGGHQADFVHHDAIANISMGASNEAHDCHRHPELKRKVYSALQESDEGELSVTIPKEVSLKQTSSTNVVYNDGMFPQRCHEL